MRRPPEEIKVAMIRAMHVMHAEIRRAGCGDVIKRTRYLIKIGIVLSLLQSRVIVASLMLK